jgi:ABC-type polar amino acid transport system ATPase subunit
MIEIENVSKTFKKKLAVDHLSLSLKDGEVFRSSWTERRRKKHPSQR